MYLRQLEVPDDCDEFWKFNYVIQFTFANKIEEEVSYWHVLEPAVPRLEAVADWVDTGSKVPVLLNIFIDT